VVICRIGIDTDSNLYSSQEMETIWLSFHYGNVALPFQASLKMSNLEVVVQVVYVSYRYLWSNASNLRHNACHE
jgi:hypothetical protein